MDNNLEIARLQQEIGKRLDLSLNHLIFDYAPEGEQMKLALITINPRHDQSFLFHTISAENKLEALRQMVDYVEQNYRQEGSYTVQWSHRGNSELHTSYFRAVDIYEVLDKFGHGRNMNDYTIFSVALNPVA